MPKKNPGRNTAGTAQGKENADPTDQSGEQPTNHEPSQPHEGTEELMLSGCRVLFVVDDRSWSDGLRSRAEAAGAEVGRASSLEELAEQLSEQWNAFWLYPQFGEQNAVELIPRLLAQLPRPGVVLFSMLGIKTKDSIELQRDGAVLLTGRSTAVNRLADTLKLSIQRAKEFEARRRSVAEWIEPPLKAGKKLRGAEFRAWQLLFRAQEQVVTGKELLEGALERDLNNQRNEDSVWHLIERLRKKLDDDQVIIITEPGRGYRLGWK